MSRSRAEMIEETRGKLLATARESFRRAGYAGTSMDDLTAAAGLTRERCITILVTSKVCSPRWPRRSTPRWRRGCRPSRGMRPTPGPRCASCRAYLEMAADPEIRRIVLQDARAVLGHAGAAARNNAPRRWASCCRT